MSGKRPSLVYFARYFLEQAGDDLSERGVT